MPEPAFLHRHQRWTPAECGSGVASSHLQSLTDSGWSAMIALSRPRLGWRPSPLENLAEVREPGRGRQVCVPVAPVPPIATPLPRRAPRNHVLLSHRRPPPTPSRADGPAATASERQAPLRALGDRHGHAEASTSRVGLLALAQLGKSGQSGGVFLRGRRTRLTLGEGARNGHSWDRRNATHPHAEAETPRCVAGRASDRRRIRLAQPDGLAPTAGAQVRCASAGLEILAQCSEPGRWLCRPTSESEWRQCERWRWNRCRVRAHPAGRNREESAMGQTTRAYPYQCPPTLPFSQVACLRPPASKEPPACKSRRAAHPSRFRPPFP